MASFSQKINETVALLEKGHYDQAAYISRTILRQRPNQPHALHLLAVACHRMGDTESALRYSERAVKLNPSSADYVSNLGRYYLSLGRLDQAVRTLRQAVSLNPHHALAQFNLAQAIKGQGETETAIQALQSFADAHPSDASSWNHLGVLLSESGRHEQALECFQRADELAPQSVESQMNIGSSLVALHRPSEALPFLIRAIELNPESIDIMTALGCALQALGHLQDAEQWFLTAIKRSPKHFNARANYALLLAARQRHAEAADLFQRLAEEQPSSYETWNNLGNTLFELARYDDALAAFERALTVKPDFFQAFTNMGNVYRRQGKFDIALANSERALRANPEFADGLNNKGVILLELGRLDEAATCFEHAIRVRPTFADALVNLSNVWRERQRLHKAVALLRQAFNHAPTNACLANNLGCSLGELGHVPEAVACYRQALVLDPSKDHPYSNLLLNLHYLPNVSPDEIWAEHRRFGQMFEPRYAHLRKPFSNTRDPGRPLRVGYVSADFRRHSVAFFLEPAIERHDRTRIQPYCYSTVVRGDRITQKFRELVSTGWRDIVGFGPEQFAKQVRADGIDILVDLGGHTGNSRMILFATKPAPIQITWLGYPDTTGLSVMDFRLTDDIADPSGETDHWHSETLVRFDRPFLCYRPAPNTPLVAPSPVAEGKPFTFGSFNTMAKISSETVRLWSSILQRVPGSRLMLKNKGLNEPESRESIYERFAKCGIGAERLLVQGQLPTLESHLDLYRVMDLALDTFPYHGTTTTCEAMWMGVPVVTLAGRTHVSRVGCSILNSVGLNNFIASTPEDYVELAVRLATNWKEWIHLRMSLRDRLQSSPLMDEQDFVTNLEAAYREMWRLWCAQGRNQ